MTPEQLATLHAEADTELARRYPVTVASLDAPDYSPAAQIARWERIRNTAKTDILRDMAQNEIDTIRAVYDVSVDSE